MAEEIGALRAALSASSAAFEKDMKAARDAVRRSANDMKTSMDSVARSFNNALKGAFSLSSIMPQLFAGASVAGLVYFVKTTIDAADRINDLSKSTGVSVETLSTMGYAANQSGVDLEALGVGFKKLNKNMTDTAANTGEAKGAFKALGISVTDNEGKMKTSEEVMLELADRFASMEDGAGKTAIAVKIFGKSGADLIPLLNEGSAGLARLQREAREAGVALTTEAAQAADEFNDNMGKLAANIKGTVIPAINWFAAAVNRAFDFPDTEKLYVAEKRLEFLREELEQLQNIDPNKFSWWRSFISEPQMTGDVLVKELEAKKKQIAEQEKIIAGLRNNINPGPQKPKKDAPIIDKEDETKKLQESIDKQIEALTLQANTFGMTEEAAALYKFTLQKGVTPAQIEAARVELTRIAIHKANAKALDETIEAEKKLAEAGKRVFTETRTPMEELNLKVKELDELLLKGAIDFDTYSRAVEQAEERFGEKIKKVNKDTKDQFEDLRRAIEGWGRDSSEAFVDFVKTGKTSFSDLVDSIITDMLRMAVYESFFKPLFGKIGGSFSGSSGNTMASGIAAASAHGNAFNKGKVVPFAKGGVINRPMTFPLGLAGEAGPEAILPLKRIGGDLGVKADFGGVGGGGMGPIIIQANDAKSFIDMCRRNPEAITSVFSRDMRMAGSTRSAIRRNL